MKVVAYPEVKTPEQILYEWLTERVWEEDLYLELANRGSVYVELDDGRIVFPMMPTVLHQTVVLNLAAALRAYALAPRTGPGCDCPDAGPPLAPEDPGARRGLLQGRTSGPGGRAGERGA